MRSYDCTPVSSPKLPSTYQVNNVLLIYGISVYFKNNVVTLEDVTQESLKAYNVKVIMQTVHIITNSL
jgi:hypothetical protein